MSLRDWLFIDARMDNTQQSARDDYDDHLAARAGAIRQHGWDETGHITRPVSEQGSWPPGDDVLSQTVRVALASDDWDFVVEQLLRGSELADSVGYHDGAARARILAAEVANVWWRAPTRRSGSAGAGVTDACRDAPMG
jgi:hypothetical protein